MRTITVEIPTWVLVELIRKSSGEEFRYILNGQHYCVRRSYV